MYLPIHVHVWGKGKHYSCVYIPQLFVNIPQRGWGRGGREERIPRALPPEEKRRKTR
jgi:hypothetical protein